eukprot:3078513-Pyramimonas_sp.AAC.1
MALGREHRLGLVEPAFFRHVQLPTTRDAPQSMMLTARYCGQEAKRLRDHQQEAFKNGDLVPELDELGIHHPHAWVSLIGALAARGGKVGQTNATELKDDQEKLKHEKLSNGDLADL